MESEGRFGGKPYPEGMCPFPFRLPGQGFFPGGDGLWRDDASLDQQSSGALPLDGIVFLANDFGTLATFRKLQSRGYENPPTWRHLKARIRRAHLPERLIFCTNAIVGLRSADGARALEKQLWRTEPGFAAFCLEFFVYQIETLRPRLLVVLGPVARASLGAIMAIETNSAEIPTRAAIGNHTTSVHFCGHPYADFNLSAERKASDALVLQRAWEKAVVDRGWL
jgi:hypothetical protein